MKLPINTNNGRAVGTAAEKSIQIFLTRGKPFPRNLIKILKIDAISISRDYL
jgi:hypothetical protein